MHSSSGHESGSSHGVHVCHKCGWPFPNPHPSAKQRRSHKKICGTVEGYKLLDSHDPSYEDHLSDEDHKTPSPKPVEKIDSEKHGGGGGGGTGETLNRSEDEVFLDAVTKFNDTGLSPGTEEHLEDARPAESAAGKIPSRNLTMFYSFKGNAVADIIEPSSNSTDSNPMINPEAHENTTNFSKSNLEFQVHVSTEEPATTFSGDKNESQENMMTNASADVAEGSIANAGQETDANGDGKVTSDRATDIHLPNEYADHSSETESKSQEIQEMTSGLLSADGVLSKESHGDATAAKISSCDLIPGIESVEHMNTIDTVPMNVNAQQDLDFVSSVNPIEGYSGKEEAKDNVHELSVPADIPVVDHAEIKPEGFKDLTGVKLNNTIDADSLEIIKDKKDDALYPVSEENFTSFQPVQCTEVPEVPVSDLPVSEDNLVHEGNKPMVEKQSTEGKSDESEIKPDELGTHVASVTIETKESLPLGSVGEQPSSYVRDDSLHKDFPEFTVNVLNDEDPVIAPEDGNEIGLNDGGNHRKAISETDDVTGNDEKKSGEQENNAKNRTTFSESATYCPEVVVNPTINVLGSDYADDHENDKIKNSAVMGGGREEEPFKEKLPTSEYATSLHKPEVVADDAVELPETKFGNLDTVSNIQDGPEQLEISANDKAQEKRVAEHDRGVELSERTSEDHATKVPPASSLSTESSIQSSVVVDDNHTGKFGGEDSVTNLSLQGESIDDQHQLCASSVDVSVDVLSQTDSLEANWGSISVLSTQSDTPVVDAETLASTDYPASAEMEKPHMKAKGETEEQHSSKSDIFEAPSFMTLVEPVGGANHRAAAPQTQTTQNLQQQNAASSQAGWFPSLTHVNESEGRKKNEEIIAKVTNWSTGKQHTPLKNLLGEAKHETRPKSPSPRENQAHAIQKDESVSKDKGAAVTTVGSILGPEDTKKETGKQANSPARYPAGIEREKRKVKGRSSWAQFMCCSSVN